MRNSEATGYAGTGLARQGWVSAIPGASLRWSARLLTAIVWVSAALFGAFILAFYLGAVSDGATQRWNSILPHLYQPQDWQATIGIGAHFAAGTVLLLLGPIQLLGSVRARLPGLHRWLGRLYVGASLITGIGGLVFIARTGTIGGTPMTIGFSLYGVLLTLAALQTVRFAMARRFEEHRAWAIRLFALAIGSWLYRMDYGFWRIIAGSAGHTPAFDGPFDVVMAFFFYIPNLLVAEAFIRGRRFPGHAGAQLGAALVLLAATVFLAIGTYFFTMRYWGPNIIKQFVGA